MTIGTPTKIQVSANTRNTDKEDQIIPIKKVPLIRISEKNFFRAKSL